MRKLLMGLALAVGMSAPALDATGYLVQEIVSGNVRICVYQVGSRTVTKTVPRYNYCPYSIYL